MTERPFVIICESRTTEGTARVEDGRVFVSPEALERATGWQVKPQGLCFGEACYPLPKSGSPVTDRGVDLEAFAKLTGQPFAMDAGEGIAALTAPAQRRTETLRSLEAPDFTLPDLDGNPHSLSDHRGKKVLLAAYASW
jgi:hypothetical protein